MDKAPCAVNNEGTKTYEHNRNMRTDTEKSTQEKPVKPEYKAHCKFGLLNLYRLNLDANY